MSTPMYDLPEHQKIGLTADGRGPVEPHEIDFDHWGCWCSDESCVLWKS